MAGMFQTGKEIVVGYAPTETSFLNKFIRYETFTPAMQYFSHRRAFRTWGWEKLAYRKTVFSITTFT
jgi:hypothetical protein